MLSRDKSEKIVSKIENKKKFVFRDNRRRLLNNCSTAIVVVIIIIIIIFVYVFPYILLPRWSYVACSVSLTAANSTKVSSVNARILALMTKRIPTINILRKYTGWKIGPFIFYYLRFTVNFRQHVFKCFNKTVRPRSRTNGSANVRHGLFVNAEGKHINLWKTQPKKRNSILS